MILKALEMQGFKSFPDKTVLEFGKGITCVVGPNGAGKSNISDAVRWVLGEQSTKSLRGARMEDVIFSGTGVRKAVGFAEVTLRLDNSDRGLNGCDKDDVSVTRRYYRSGESEYLINGGICRLRDVHELFMDTGLGRDGYSLVGQGRIAELVSARSSQRRDMIEEAAGISHLRYRREDASRRLEQAEENLIRLRDILSELDDRIGPLKAQSDKAQKFLALAKDKRELEIGLWLHTIEKSTAGLREQENRLALASSQYEQTGRELEELAQSIEQHITIGQEITLEIERVRLETAAGEEEAAGIEGKIAVENNTLEHNNETIERITRDMSAASETSSKIQAQIDAAEAEIEQLNLQIIEKREALEAILEQAELIRGEDSSNSDKARQLSEAITAKTMRLSDCRVEKSTAESTIEELRGRIAAIEEVFAARGGLLKEIEEEKTQCKLQLSEIREELSGYENSLEGYGMLVSSKTAKADAARKETERINLDIYQKNARISMLNDLEKNMDGYQGSVQKVIQQSKRGVLRGIHGTLSQLITVEGEYAVAVETALGSAIQNIVTDNEDDAKRAISFLQENRAGRATFLPISAISSKPFTEKGLSACEGFVDMADKLLTYDSKYSEIIKSFLCRTAVVDNIDSAIAMAKKYSYRFKIVTLDGQVLNAGGSMTGGSRGQNTGFLSRANEIEDLRQAVKRLEGQLEEKQTQLKSVLGELSGVQAQLDATNAEISKSKEALVYKESELSVLEDRYVSAKGHLDDLADEKGRANARVKENQALAAAAQSECDALISETEALTAELASLDERRGTLLARREETADAQAQLNLQEVALRKDIEAKKEIIGELRRRFAVHGMKADELNDEIASIAQNSIDAKARIAELKARAELLRSQGSDAKAQIAALVERRTKSEAQGEVMRSAERSKMQDKEKISGELARLEERRDTMRGEIENAQNKLYDEYQLTLREAQELDIKIEDIPKAGRELQEIRSKIRALGNVNVGAVEEYKEVYERHTFMSAQVNDIEKAKEALTALIGELTGKMAERFREQFRRINNNFGETFKELFDGGRAELVLEDAADVLECNIDIRVQPPGKNVQNIDLLSGGEKGLSAIALLFAILKVTPSPFCIFDEVEAALDDINVSRYAKYVRSITGNTQFILISHRRGTMEEADVLYGVTMQEEGVSKLLELKTAEMAKKLGLA